MMERSRPRTLVLNGRETSVTVEDIFWDVITATAKAEGIPRQRFIELLDAARPHGVNLSAAVRIAAMRQVQRELEKAQKKGKRR